MNSSTGFIDRVFRFLFGSLLLSIFFAADGGIRYVGLFGLIPLATSMIEYCGRYALVGAKICKS